MFNGYHFSSPIWISPRHIFSFLINSTLFHHMQCIIAFAFLNRYERFSSYQQVPFISIFLGGCCGFVMWNRPVTVHLDALVQHWKEMLRNTNNALPIMSISTLLLSSYFKPAFLKFEAINTMCVLMRGFWSSQVCFCSNKLTECLPFNSFHMLN